MKVFITGITGTLGTALARLHRMRGDAVCGCARNESGVVRWEWTNHDPWVKARVGDAFDLRDRDGVLARALATCDRCYHTAAVKHVELCEADPVEAVRENVALTEVVSLACKEAGVDLVLASTDKAFRPEGVYGATKLVAERIVVGRGGSALRMVNLIGSSGSVLHRWAAAAGAGGEVRLTDPDMTRYFMTVDDAARQMADVSGTGVRTVEGVKAARMGDLAEAVAGRFDKDVRVNVVGPRPGEVTHQWLDEGRCSESAERWDVEELLDQAGINGGRK